MPSCHPPVVYFWATQLHFSQWPCPVLRLLLGVLKTFPCQSKTIPIQKISSCNSKYADTESKLCLIHRLYLPYTFNAVNMEKTRKMLAKKWWSKNLATNPTKYVFPTLLCTRFPTGFFFLEWLKTFSVGYLDALCFYRKYGLCTWFFGALPLSSG